MDTQSIITYKTSFGSEREIQDVCYAAMVAMLMELGMRGECEKIESLKI